MCCRLVRLVGIWLTLVVTTAESGRGYEPLTLTLAASAKRGTSIEPLYFAIRISNTSERIAELSEPFSSEYGDVRLYFREAGSGGFWQQAALAKDVGRADIRRIPAREIRPGECLEVIECVVPAAFATIDAERELEFQSHFVRKKGLVLSNLVTATIVPSTLARPATVETILDLLEVDPKLKLTTDSEEALNDAAEKSLTLARTLDVTKRFRATQTFDRSRSQREDVQEFADLLEKLPAIEREYWAIEFGSIHLSEAGRLLNRLELSPAQVTFHLDVCAALDKSLGTATERAQGIRHSSAAYRKRLAEYIQQDEVKQRSTNPP